MEKNPDRNGTDAAGPRRRRRLGRFRRIVQWTFNLAVLAMLVLVFTRAEAYLGNQLVVVDAPAKADYIVILGGSGERVAEGWRLFREGWADKVILSSNDSDADRLAAIAESYGIPREAMLIDRKATHTATHPRSVAQLPGVDKLEDTFILVTSPFHTARSKAVFLKDGYRHVLMRSPGWRTGGDYPPDRYGWTVRARHVAEKAYELMAWTVYKLRGWV